MNSAITEILKEIKYHEEDGKQLNKAFEERLEILKSKVSSLRLIKHDQVFFNSERIEEEKGLGEKEQPNLVIQSQSRSYFERTKKILSELLEPLKPYYGVLKGFFVLISGIVVISVFINFIIRASQG